jgi:hypothetical protein
MFCSEPGYPRQLEALAAVINQPLHSDLIRHFLFDHLYPNAPLSGDNVNLDICPSFSSKISVFHSAMATYYAPSDHSGLGGMHRERIHVMPSWRNAQGRYDCMFLEKNSALPGFNGLHVAQVTSLLIFFFQAQPQNLPLRTGALVCAHW